MEIKAQFTIGRYGSDAFLLLDSQHSACFSARDHATERCTSAGISKTSRFFDVHRFSAFSTVLAVSQSIESILAGMSVWEKAFRSDGETISVRRSSRQASLAPEEVDALVSWCCARDERDTFQQHARRPSIVPSEVDALLVRVSGYGNYDSVCSEQSPSAAQHAGAQGEAA